ncbi:MAG TPA: hypothetical protein VKZ53_14050 [Candidatus Angelobacter sp.]|nr:hypothetical protein [Candidatus Angelobacter sp.]
MAFQQAQIQVQKTEEFEWLRAAVESALASRTLERFYKKLERHGIRIREFERVLDFGLLEQLDAGSARPGKAKELYRSLALSDQALLREFYLERIELVDSKLREKYQKIYRYY